MALAYPVAVRERETSTSPSRPIVVNKSSVEKEESSLATAKTTADEGSLHHFYLFKHLFYIWWHKCEIFMRI